MLGQSSTVSFQVKKSLPGEYTFNINGNAGKFKVIQAAPSQEGLATPQATLAPAAANLLASSPPVPSPQKAPSGARVTVPFIWVIIGIVAIIGIIILVLRRFMRSSRW